MIRSVIKGTGSALPARVMTNAEMADKVDTSDEWIVERTGIRQRHIAGESESTATMAAEASRRALEAAGIAAGEIRPLDVPVAGHADPRIPDDRTIRALPLFTALQIAAERCCIRCVPRWNAFCMISLLPRSHNTVSFTAASFHPAAVFRSWSV